MLKSATNLPHLLIEEIPSRQNATLAVKSLLRSGGGSVFTTVTSTQLKFNLLHPLWNAVAR